MMMLAIDSTAAIATGALFRDGLLITEREADASKKHAETLLPLIDDLLEENGLTIENMDLFAVDIGPGSFTGVRIGVSLVNALAFASGKMIVPVDSLETLSRTAGKTENPVCAMIDARNGNAYAALYQAGKTLMEPGAVVIESFLAGLPQDTVLVGDVKTETKTYPRARFAGLCALAHLERAKEEVEPVYLRVSQAERLKQESNKQA
ncbi:MAG: tRNA (adenosine(37)-N6)-threonylcarbamoyltransferase complex dimerization subunit type 1 TsaB [Eubacteriales bacterium]|jgi:tRNA threonylcarbamoyladenosine biosynthesis protein TsaB|nr:tRNA (adenosine(37)-N6)-threonylcarbamoyltransferase complex dimerization subunit type 1 TsaB [Eubacteriales bacterium]